jgi:hypothetical protein
VAALLTACTASSGVQEPISSSTVTGSIGAITADQLEGDWGLASYRNEADRARTEAEAKSACSNPYSIARGKAGGVMMHLADQTQPQEVYLKTGPTGQTYLGPKGSPAMPQDRLIVSFGEGILVTQWVDPGASERFGTMVFVRCAA